MAFRYIGMGQRVQEDPEGASAEINALMAANGSNMGVVADHYGVVRATLKRWLDLLEAAGYPVAGRGEAKRGWGSVRAPEQPKVRKPRRPRQVPAPEPAGKGRRRRAVAP